LHSSKESDSIAPERGKPSYFKESVLMPSHNGNSAQVSVRIRYEGRRCDSVVLRPSGERVWLEGDEFEVMRIVKPAGMESEPFYHRVGRPYEAALSVVFQALSERRRLSARRGVKA
jgi:hypothetical protein